MVVMTMHSVAMVMQVCPPRQCISHVAVRTDLFNRDPDKTPITDFFGSVRNIEISTDILSLDDAPVVAKQQQCDAISCHDDSKELPRQRPKFFYANQMPFNS